MLVASADESGSPQKISPGITEGASRKENEKSTYPITFIYGIFTFIWLFFVVNVVKYTLGCPPSQ